MLSLFGIREFKVKNDKARLAAGERFDHIIPGFFSFSLQ